MTASVHSASFYAASTQDQNFRESLSADIVADVCIVGAGYTGLSSALILAKSGLKVVVLESKRVGFGASGRNGGQIIHSYARDLDFIEKHYGLATSSSMAAQAFDGANIVRRTINRYNIECELKNGSIFAACNTAQLKKLKKKKTLWEAHGHCDLTLLDKQDMQSHVGSMRYTGGLLDDSGGHLHPLKLVQGEARALESLGGGIFEGSKVMNIQVGETPKVMTARGSVTAKHVLVAGNAYQGDLIPRLRQNNMICSTNMIATEPLTQLQQKEILPSDVCVEDGNYLMDYFRLSADKRLIYGGGVNYGDRGRNKTKRGIVNAIAPKMLRTFPQLKNTKIDYAWGGNYLLTPKRLPQVGAVGSNIYYAQGYSGHGLTCAHLCGEILAEAIQGDYQRYDIFSNFPQNSFPGGRGFHISCSNIRANFMNILGRF